MNPSPVKIKGAGIKGLSLAFFLKQKGVDSVIYEASDRVGGWIKTVKASDFLFETGPRGFRPNLLTLKMIDDLGLSGSLIYPDSAAKKRFIYSKGKLNSLVSFLPRLGLGLLRDLIMPQETEELSIKDHFDKRLGKWCTDHLIDPLSSGIFAGDIKKLSAKKCFPSMTSEGSILTSMISQPKTPLISFSGGMEVLVKALQEGQKIVYKVDDQVCDIDCTPNPAYDSTSVVAVNFGWKNLKLPKKGFGYLIPSFEKSSILGAVFDSCTFPCQNNYPNEARVTVMMGGAHHPEYIDFPEEDLKEIAWTALSNHLKIKALPDVYLVHKAKNAIPQPVVGSRLTGVGVNHAIQEAFNMAKALLQN